MEGAGWWLISLVPCENSHPSLPYSPAAAFSPRQQQSPRYLASPPPRAPPWSTLSVHPQTMAWALAEGEI